MEVKSTFTCGLIFRFLSLHTSVNRLDIENALLLCAITLSVDLQVVRILLQYNCSAKRLWQGPGGQSYSLFNVALRHGYVDLLPMLADVGADVRCSPYNGDISTDVLSNDEVVAWLNSITNQPRSLQQHCRQRIRQLLTCNIHIEAKSLPLPVTLQQYILQTL
jgi:SOCS box